MIDQVDANKTVIHMKCFISKYTFKIIDCPIKIVI